jgi:hypothetical protein
MRSLGYATVLILLWSTGCTSRVARVSPPSLAKQRLAVDLGGRASQDNAADSLPSTAPASSLAPVGERTLAATRTVRLPKAKTGAPASSDSEKKTGAERLLIYTAGVTLRVLSKDFEKILDATSERAIEAGGYIVLQTRERLVLRLPSAQFYAFVRGIDDLGEVTSRRIESKDVSEEYHDLKIRLKSLVAMHSRVADFLKKAQGVADILRIERELSRLARDIDRVQGRMRFLATRAAFSKVDVRLQVKQPVRVAKRATSPKEPVFSLPIQWVRRVGLGTLLRGK